MKKIFFILLATALLTACGSQPTTAPTPTTETATETSFSFSELSGRCDPYKDVTLDQETLRSLFANNFEAFENATSLDDVPEDFYKAITVMLWQDDDEYYDIGLSAYTALTTLEKENPDMFKMLLPDVKQTFEDVSKFSVEDVLILEFIEELDNEKNQ